MNTLRNQSVNQAHLVHMGKPLFQRPAYNFLIKINSDVLSPGCLISLLTTRWVGDCNWTDSALRSIAKFTVVETIFRITFDHTGLSGFSIPCNLLLLIPAQTNGQSLTVPFGSCPPVCFASIGKWHGDDSNQASYCALLEWWYKMFTWIICICQLNKGRVVRSILTPGVDFCIDNA